MTRQSRPAWSVIQYIEESFEVEWLDAKARTIEDIDVLLLIAPQNISNELLMAIDQYVLSGGRALVFLDPYSEALSGMSGMPSVQRSDLDALLPSWGLSLKQGEFLKDYAYSMVVGVGPERNPVRHLGLLGMTPESMDQSDIILYGLETLNWSTTGVLEAVEGATSTIQPLVLSSDQAQTHVVEDLLQLHDPQDLMKGFAPTGEQYMVAARVTGPAKTAFPDGLEIEEEIERTDEEASEESEPEFKTETLMPALSESDDIQVLVFADSDVLSDRLWVQVKNFCTYKELPRKLSAEAFDFAVENYFSVM